MIAFPQTFIRLVDLKKVSLEKAVFQGLLQALSPVPPIHSPVPPIQTNMPPVTIPQFNHHTIQQILERNQLLLNMIKECQDNGWMDDAKM